MNIHWGFHSIIVSRFFVMSVVGVACTLTLLFIKEDSDNKNLNKGIIELAQVLIKLGVKIAVTMGILTTLPNIQDGVFPEN